MKAVPPRRRQCCGSTCPGQLPEPTGVLAACAPDGLFHPLAAASVQAQVTANRLRLREWAAASRGLWTLRAVLFQGRLLLSSLLTPSKCLPLGETEEANRPLVFPSRSEPAKYVVLRVSGMGGQGSDESRGKRNPGKGK